MSDAYHIPVLLHESIEALTIKPDGVYVDLTFGGGGHSREIIKHLNAKGKLVAFDQDADAQKNAIADERFLLFPNNFRHFKKFLRIAGITQVDGILADLGISSYQIDQPERGFSIRSNATLDMRMNNSAAVTAEEIINTYSEKQLVEIFSKYGEIRNAKQLANTIFNARIQQPIKSTMQLVDVAKTVVKGEVPRYLAQLFQAIRIEVNDEMRALEEMLESVYDVLAPNGKLVVISYHSLEDRIVKHVMKTGNVRGEIITDLKGVGKKYFQIITKKPIEASEDEVKKNPRARSAKMRVAEKIKE
ncbi:MAG: 16S rRNA (cytosine(1402)-N(4))-methyltransferase RsmH [Chitinophagales bacterium]|nr:16S rRNA (cytosine(1402)-N(4))-methyltransferase RsmH [Bacteroidota bacterium]MBP7400097.1 16S rRNA (cytosine(1402)-N(4))-methyltransferase RsmH [Chitinophagales bacterium]MBK8681729.1 16S rRNA (cytosine(1402)-N(4))-methyltransferase RsmH [Bacteroidota bacterium]MBP8754230.1 16S rRNA (cytosine(1402)-N(4))-methyltransferase RsmH [Chitinophagales bacterium]MBP9188690.1 16S rRNA (cytosine(1402)-N(4))-methyltransferase RsmH [Chitinophagales bacterium]